MGILRSEKCPSSAARSEEGMPHRGRVEEVAQGAVHPAQVESGGGDLIIALA